MEKKEKGKKTKYSKEQKDQTVSEKLKALKFPDPSTIKPGPNDTPAELQFKERMMFWATVNKLAPDIKDYFVKKMEADTPIFTTSIWVLCGLILVIIITTALMAAYDIISGESFTFLMGVLIGYIMTHLKALFVVQEE